MSDFNKCPQCKEWAWLDRHVCGPYYLVRPDYYDPGEGEKAYGSNPGEAAEKWLERRFSDFDYPQSMTVIVTDAQEKTQWKIEVTVEAVPSFSAEVLEESQIEAEEEESEVEE